MTDIWVTSDTHYNHNNIIKYCNRPYKDPQEMNEALLENYNSIVKPNDTVYHLGDVYFPSGKGMREFIPKLHGEKHLILGNHDNAHDQILLRNFVKIYMGKIFKNFGLIMTHVPVHPISLGGYINLHGHIHDLKINDCRYINVCVENTEYKPVNLEELKDKAKNILAGIDLIGTHEI